MFFGTGLADITGFGVGSICVEIFQVSNFEGGAGMLVFYTFTPVGATIGGILGAWLLGRLGMKKDAELRISRPFAFAIWPLLAVLFGGPVRIYPLTIPQTWRRR